MAELKTRETDADVDAYIDTVADDARRADCRALLQLMRDATKMEPKMWGKGMVGFGRYHYRYDSGREGDWFITGFAARKGDLTLYIMPGFDQYEGLLAKLGRHKTGKSCLYVKRLADVDLDVLKHLVTASVRQMKRQYG